MARRNTSYVNFHNSTTGHDHQLWFDSPGDMAIKYEWAVARGFGGVGMWVPGSSLYDRVLAKAYWNVVPAHGRTGLQPARELKSDDTAAAISLRDALTRSAPTGRRFDGVGGFACVGGARLLYDYAEPQRGALLDALFSPGVGASYQILKTEIPGDMDSSYGSGPAYRHSAEDAADFQRGIYLPWLHQEAKRRNPSIKTCECRISLPSTCTCSVFL